MTAIFELVEVRHIDWSPPLLEHISPVDTVHIISLTNSFISFIFTDKDFEIRKIGWKFWVEWESSPDLLFTFFFLAHIFHIHSKFLLIVFQMQSSVIFLQLILRIFWHIHNHLLQIKFLIQLCDMQTTKSFVEQSSSQNYLAFWN